MSKKMESLLAKRAAIDKEIADNEALQKRKAIVHKLVFGALEKYPLAAQVDDAVLREALHKTFGELAQNLPAAQSA